MESNHFAKIKTKKKMKTTVLKTLAVMLTTFMLCSFTAKHSSILKQSGHDEELVLLKAGQEAWATDGTHIPPQSTDVNVRICPGSGSPCSGTATVGTLVISYNGSKGVLRPDIIVTL